MTLLRAASLLLSTLLLPCVAFALTLQPQALSTPQTTCPYCFFPQPLAAVVRDDAGNPVAGVPVLFSAPSPAHGFVPRTSAPYSVVTDGSGVARLPSPGLVGSELGAFTLTATSPQAGGEARFELTVAGSPPSWIGLSTRDPETGVAGLPYRSNFVVRAFDAANQPLANAAVEFIAPASGPSGTFDGLPYTHGQASATGFAGSTTMLLANEILGRGEIMIRSLDPAVAPVFVGIVNSAPGAATIEAIPGTAAQVTRVTAFFPDLIGAVVRDASGAPLKDAAVRFSLAYTASSQGFFFTEAGGFSELVAITGADGVAMSPARALALSVGVFDVTASVPGVEAPLRYDFTAIAGGTRSVAVVSGDYQRAIVGTTFKNPWVLRMMGGDGAPVPYAGLQVFAIQETIRAGGSFAGRSALYLMADRDGFITLPPFTANAIVGSNYVSAYSYQEPGYAAGAASLWFANVAKIVTYAFNRSGPDSVAAGETSTWWYDLVLLDESGRFLPNTPYRYSVDPSCASFAAGAEYAGVTDEYGWAYAAGLRGVAARSSCPVTFWTEGLQEPVVFPLHVFDPDQVSLVAETPSLEIIATQEFTLAVRASVDGRPVNITGLTMSIGTSASGATAAIDRYAMLQMNSGRYGAALRSNDRPGTYTVRASYRNASATTTVKQRPR